MSKSRCLSPWFWLALLGLVLGCALLAGLGTRATAYAQGEVTPLPTDTPPPTATPPPTDTPPPTVTTPPTATAIPTPVGRSDPAWQMVFEDEFDTVYYDATKPADDPYNKMGIDPAKWYPCYWWAPTLTTGCKLDSDIAVNTVNNVHAETVGVDKVLRLSIRKEPVELYRKTYNYTAGMVSTGTLAGNSRNPLPARFTYTYGYAEARIKMPRGAGLWPAFWQVVENQDYEIDTVEFLGKDLTTAYLSYHSPTENSGTTSFVGPDFSADYHIFATEWKPGEIIWYVDGVERKRFTSPNVSPLPMNLYLTSSPGSSTSWACQGATGPCPDDSALPADVLIDYVRVWQKPAPGDTIAPTVTITKPSNGATVRPNSQVTITATASDNVAVTKVEFYANNALVCTDITSPYSCTWRVPSGSGTSYVVTAKAYDAAGNVGSSATVRVTSR